jgi:chromosome segregation ATPase
MKKKELCKEIERKDKALKYYQDEIDTWKKGYEELITKCIKLEKAVRELDSENNKLGYEEYRSQEQIEKLEKQNHETLIELMETKEVIVGYHKQLVRALEIEAENKTLKYEKQCLETEKQGILEKLNEVAGKENPTEPYKGVLSGTTTANWTIPPFGTDIYGNPV